MTTTTSLQSLIEEIRRVLEGMPQQYAPLLALVMEECPGELWVLHPAVVCHKGVVWPDNDSPSGSKRKCMVCFGAGYVTRTDWGRDEGALRGAIDYAACMLTGDAVALADMYRDHISRVKNPRTNHGAAQALLAALKEMRT